MAELHRHHLPRKICVVGSGNWGSVIAKIVGNNVCDHKEAFQETIQMYVYEELVGGQKLTEIINTKHENVKYMPGCKIPENVFANPNVINACSDADILVFVLPHQFMTTLCSQLSGKIKPTAIGVSLVKVCAARAGSGRGSCGHSTLKGVFGLDCYNGELDLISNTIRRGLNIDCAVLMGANLASEVAQENFCEATIGCRNAVTGQLLKDLFQTSYFRITVVPDEETVELCGALKNIVALAAGFADGLSLGDNTKAAVIRIGLMEMIAFSRRFFPGSNLETFLQSCGIADLLTTAYGGGRNRKVSEAFAAGKGKTIEELEKVMLNGQKLQGPPTAAEVYEILVQKGKKDGTDWCKRFPIFTHVHMVCVGLLQPADFIQCLFDHPEHA